MKNKIYEFKLNTERGLKRLCGKPSPRKRLVTVLMVCVALAFVNVWFLVSAIHNIGKNDSEKELIKLQHIERLELQKNSMEHKEYKELKECK